MTTDPAKTAPADAPAEPDATPDADPPPVRLTFPKSRHLRQSAEFSRVYAAKNRAGDDRLLVYAAANELGHPRIGLSVSKKNGNAVRRNLIKRRLREAFRLDQHGLPQNLDLVLIPRPGNLASLAGYRSSLARLAAKLARRLAERDAEQ